jgi:hypothetical protein
LSLKVRAILYGGLEIADPFTCSGCRVERPGLLLVKTEIGLEALCPDCIERRDDQGLQSVEFCLEQQPSERIEDNNHLDGIHEQVIRLREKGASLSKIARDLERSKSTIATHVGQHNNKLCHCFQIPY